MRILGIDVGFAICGWAVVESAGSVVRLIDFGVIQTDKSMQIQDRLEIVYSGVREIIKKFDVEQVAVEDIFFSKNSKTVINVSQVRGVILLAGQQEQAEIFKYTPLQVKMAVTGYGKAEKIQVQEMVQRIFKLKELPRPDDAADAVAIAYCHSNSQRYD